MAELTPGERSAAQVAVSRDGGDPLVAISGELDLSTTEQVRSAVEAALDGGQHRVVFDLSELTFMDSSGIALLVRVAQRVGEVELRNPTPIVRRLIELTGLAQTLRLVP
jgi:anti-sigma B factor antagonist